MSASPTSPDHGLGRLVEEGYDVALLGGCLCVGRIPYVTRDRTVGLGTLITPLAFERGQIAPPSGHQVSWSGDIPCDATGRPLHAILHQNYPRRLAGLEAEHMFCAKPLGREYRDYHEMMTTFAVLLGDPAAIIEPLASARGFSRVTSSAADASVMRYAELAGLVSASYPMKRLDNMVLDDATLARLKKIVEEHRNRTKLAEHGLKPRRKFLLVGPPGTGKTLTASALAGELGLPLFTILLDGVINKYMGETSSKIRLVFDAMRTTRGVYFFDEVDALATKRLMGNDVGEARRTLNSILQMLDEDDGDALIIAATNHAELLDPAMFRRFDSAIEYSVLPKDRIREIFSKSLMPFDLGAIDWRKVEDDAVGMSQAEMIRVAEDAAREAVLGNDARLTTVILSAAIKERRGDLSPKR